MRYRFTLETAEQTVFAFTIQGELRIDIKDFPRIEDSLLKGKPIKFWFVPTDDGPALMDPTDVRLEIEKM